MAAPGNGKNLPNTKQEAPPPAKKSIVDIVADRVNQFIARGEIDLPRNYSPENALKSAYLALQTVKDKQDKSALEVCDRASIANALLDMIVQGLNPGKKQVYFIVYGKTLVAQRSYFGSMAVAEMVNPAIKDWGYNVVYEGDTFRYGILNGKASVIEHAQEFGNINNAKIAGAYAMALDRDGKPIKTEIMSVEQIHQAWKQSKANPVDGQGNVNPNTPHGKFPADFALRTVINKVCKIIINASSDNALLLERINRNEDLSDAAGVQMEIEEKANTGSVIMMPEEPGKVEEPSPTDPPAPIPTTGQEGQQQERKPGW